MDNEAAESRAVKRTDAHRRCQFKETAEVHRLVLFEIFAVLSTETAILCVVGKRR
jgi:hypothetical protein